MLNQVSTEPSHWSTVSFTIKQLAQIVSSGTLLAFCISLLLRVLSSFCTFYLNKADLYLDRFIAKPNSPVSFGFDAR